MVSETVKWALELAKIEALETSTENLSVDHVFIGVCSLDKMFSPLHEAFRRKHVQENLTYRTIQNLMNEHRELKQLFQYYGHNIENLGESIRNSLKDPSYITPPPQWFDVDKKDWEWQKKFYTDAAYYTAVREGKKEEDCLYLMMYLLKNYSATIDESMGYYRPGEVMKELRYRIQRRKDDSSGVSHYNSYSYAIETPYLNELCTDLTKMAAEGKIDPIIGREDEILQLIRTLTRKKKNNPLLIGEAGVGKTSLIKALAQKIVEGKVPLSLMNKRIYEINMTSIVAGTKYRGEFEQKMQLILSEARDPHVILFIDEFHTILGAGLSEGTSLDVSNILKPALQEGNLTCIGATTTQEYRRYVKKDPAFERRFQAILVKEPSSQATKTILQGLRASYEDFYGVRISDAALEAAVDLSIQYLPQKRLPDKALDLMEDACSMRTTHTDGYVYHNYQFRDIDTSDIIQVLEKRISIPLKMGLTERQEILEMDGHLKKVVVGQDKAIDALCKRIKISRAGLNDPERPSGVFMFMGPTGVGKTLLAKSLGDYLFGKQRVIKLDMSEYMDPGSLNKLIGAPPGFMGNEEGILSSALQSNPYSVVLLDEIEKAHYSIFDIFLQIFDEGQFTDGKGVEVDARHALFIMTSNLAVTDSEFERAYGIEGDKKTQEKKNREGLIGILRPEFVNRIDEVIIFNQLTKGDMKKITQNMLQEVAHLLDNQGMVLDAHKSAIDYLAQVGLDPLFGARPLKRTIDELVKVPISEMMINGELVKGDNVVIKMQKGGMVVRKLPNFHTSTCPPDGMSWEIVKREKPL